ncbi:DUF3619 family protein [Burkholderia sp. TSV86]|uniref:DUF3619 family protein n=1 Tax=Burkholderia sp. TSV86 TaxID=1385594 RepID=UPI0007587F54|nr:DUF3619 family protein [Burkholderia sp. TSV86]KVE39185.1 hypothetical protein WS68_20485 [Burkholderia sp. TSV86]
MSSAPATKEELELAFKIRRALDERAAALPASTVQRLAAARRAALARKKPDASIVLVPALAGGTGALELRMPDSTPHRKSLGRRLIGAWPLVLLLAGLIGIAYWEDMQRTAELADIDAAMLSDNLPLDAYLDHGFNAYLSHAH